MKRMLRRMMVCAAGLMMAAAMILPASAACPLQNAVQSYAQKSTGTSSDWSNLKITGADLSKLNCGNSSCPLTGCEGSTCGTDQSCPANSTNDAVKKIIVQKTGNLPSCLQDGTCDITDKLQEMINNNDGVCADGNCENEQTVPSETPVIPQVTPDETDKTEIEQPAENNTQTGTTVLAMEREIVDLVNEIRSANGLQTLTLNEELCNVARIKSQDMHDKGYFSHTSPTYGSPFDMMKQFGITYRTAGENIAMGYPTAEAVVDGWMNSEGHRANILNASFTEIGVGYVADGNYYTQMFIG